MPKYLAIFGASGHGKVLGDLAEELGYKVSFYDDAFPVLEYLECWRVVGDFNDLLQLDRSDINVIVAIGSNKIRESKVLRLKEAGFKLVSLIHPSAVISKYAFLGIASVVMAGAVINPFVRLGDGCIVNTNATIDHDCTLHDFVHVSPNATLAGGVELGSRTWVGMSSCIKQLIKIGNDCVIGMGSVVINDVESNIVAYGVPATSKKLINSP